MDLPHETDLLSFSGPAFITIKGQKQILPVPKYATGTLLDASFKLQANGDLYAEKFVLHDVLDQKFSSYPSFVRLASDKNVGRVDLEVLKTRVTTIPGYGSKELVRDLDQMEQQVASKSTQKKDKKFKKQIRFFSYMKSTIVDEIAEFENCNDCVGNYYIFDQPNYIPCRRPHSLVVFREPGNDDLIPAKVLMYKSETDSVKVALFVPQGKRLWIKRENVTLLSLRETWSQHKPRSQHQRAFDRLFKHLLMLISRFGRLYVGPASAEKTLMPNQCFAPDAFFVSLSGPVAGRLEIRGPVSKRSEPSKAKSAANKENAKPASASKPKKTRVRKRIKCGTRGCPKRGPCDTWGVGCYLCPIRYCSPECREQDTPRHAFNCTLELADDSISEQLDLAYPLNSETMELVQEELQQWDALFGANDAIQFVDSSIEVMVQGQNESGVSRSDGNDRHNERTFVEADDLMGFEVGDCHPTPADTQLRGLVGGQDRSG